MRDYYQILEVSETSSLEEIKQAYRNLAKRYHPDINKSPEAHQRFIEISEAYEVLVQRKTEQDVTSAEVDYEEFLRDIREAAKKQARMRYERFERQHEAFRQSGLYDVGLLLKYLGRILLPLISLGMITVPILVCISEESIKPFFYLFFLWVIGSFLLYNTYQERAKFFHIGKFYYTFSKIKSLYVKTNENVTDTCFYCAGRLANSIPFKLELVKVKDIQLRNDGPMQHQAGYNRKYITILFPRSQKAFVVHSVVSVVKLVSILMTLILLPLSSLLWRFIVGIFVGWILSSIILFICHTQSKTSYLFSYGICIKVILWIGLIGCLSIFKFSPFDILTTPYINFGIVFFLFFDAFIEQILKIPKKVRLFKPIPNQYTNLTRHFDERCQLYLEMPFWTTIYPFVRWVF
jgi:hypothetical protein